MDNAIGIGRLEPRVADELRAVGTLLHAVDDDAHALANVSLGRRKAKLLRKVDEALRALEFDLVGHLVGHGSGPRALLGRVGKHGAVVELLVLKEVEQLLRLLIRLAGKASHGRRAKHHAGNLLAQVRKEGGELLRRPLAAHALEHGSRAVLDGDVDVGQHLRDVANCGDELLGHALGLQVENAHPATVGAHDLSYLSKKRGKSSGLLEVGAPDAGVLPNEDDLSNSAVHEGAYLITDLVRIAGAVAPTNVRNGTKGAEPVAALGDLHVGTRAVHGAQHALGDAGRNVALQAQHAIHNVYDTVLVVGVHEGRNLGKLVRERGTVARRNAAAHNDGEGATLVLLLLRNLEGGIERLLRGRDEKGAGVDKREVGLIGIVRLVVAGAEEQGAHAVGVYLVLGAPTSDEENAWHKLTLSVVNVLEGLAVVVAAKQGDDLLQRVFGGRAYAKLVALDGSLCLELGVTDILGNPLGQLGVDALDKVPLLTHAHARGSLHLVPAQGSKVNAALNELGSEDVTHLTRDEL